MKNVICPGCGVSIETDDEGLDNAFFALNACRKLCYELSYYTLELKDPYFIHQLVVDTYAAQHAGPDVKLIQTTFALVGLYLVNERNYSGREVQLVHMQLAGKSKDWPRFTQRNKKADKTIKDILSVEDNEKQKMIHLWCTSVWEIWKDEEKAIENLLEKYLQI